jgi:hypothetical protein
MPLQRRTARRPFAPGRVQRAQRTGDIYGHTSDDTARAAVEGLTGQLGLLD